VAGFDHRAQRLGQDEKNPGMSLLMQVPFGANLPAATCAGKRLMVRAKRK
jgi:hypothetical protein